MTSVAIDDEPLALELIKNYAGQLPGLELVKIFNDPIAGVHFLKSKPVDLLFIDINMPDISGLDLVRSLKVKPLIIFTTAYKDFAFDGFELEAIDYLLKPFDFDRFSKAVQKAQDFYSFKHGAQTDTEESLFVHSEYKLIKIPISQIEYIESLEDYIRIHLTNAKPVLTLMSLKKVCEKLPHDKFKRIHRGYIIPVSKVKAIANRKVLLTSGKELPISESYLQFIQEWKNS
ncbi:response regulator transcription factor [Adhaeribacter sp. BT258]|uniref:Response regulator transcription factor n=1 Tax=Adhaeribacter terrigena TaxID=2793070 RepID=A0ABS1C054_9BACT|nr:response regulator transcription factor [Adhaeribacter terrigena]